jgi:hypothetical protein
MESLFQSSLRIILIVLLTPLLVLLLQKLMPLKSNFKPIEVNPIEGEKLANKRNRGCLLDWLGIGSLLFLIEPLIGQPLYSWINQYPDALLIEHLERLGIYTFCAYISAPLTIIFTNYWFILQYGEKKFNLLQNYYNAKYKFDNLKLERFIFYVILLIAVFVMFVTYNPTTFVTEKELCYREELSFQLERKSFNDIEKMDYIENVLYKDGECSGWPKYRIVFKDGTKFHSRDINGYTPESNSITHKMYQYMSQKSGKPIHVIECISLSEY